MDDLVIEAARAIRPYLDRLVDPYHRRLCTVDELDRYLTDALNDQSNRPTTAARLRILLGDQQDTAWFLAQCSAPFFLTRINE